ncbi:putative reverse transcriptase domain-containing protein [Tanacetum coccineum]
MDMEATVRTRGTEGVVGLTRWIEKMESVFNISGCAIENQVKFATCTLLGAALTWVEIKKIRNRAFVEPKGSRGTMFQHTLTFPELTLDMYPSCCQRNRDKYISGLPDNIYGNVKSARPKTLDETIELTDDLMDQKLRTYPERKSDNKRKADDSSRNNHGHQQQPFKRQNVAKVYNMGTGERKPYGGSLPKCTKCHLHHNGPCTQKCHKCNKVGHFARDCRSTSNTNVANTQKGNGAAPKGNGCFECGAPGHFKRDCPKLKNRDGGNGNAQGWVYAVGNAEKRGNASGNPDANVVTGLPLASTKWNSKIRLISRSRAIARELYRLVPSKMKEYRKKLQELIDKGFIRLVHITGSSIYSKIDLRSGYHQLRSSSKDIPKDGIRTRYGYSEFLDEKEHEEHLKAILELLKKEKLYAKFSKCEFWIPKVQFLGHVMDSRGIHVDPVKIESLKDWASPKTPTEIR